MLFHLFLHLNVQLHYIALHHQYVKVNYFSLAKFLAFFNKTKERTLPSWVFSKQMILLCAKCASLGFIASFIFFKPKDPSFLKFKGWACILPRTEAPPASYL